MKLLVVDDNPAQRRALAESLRSRGFEVVTASSGEEALARLRQEGVDLVVADVFMPRLDGLQLCHAVKADPQLSRIPCVLYSALCTGAEDEALARQAGAAAFVALPVDEETLAAALQQARQAPAARRPALPPPADAPVRLEAYDARLVHRLAAQAQRLARANAELRAEQEALGATQGRLSAQVAAHAQELRQAYEDLEAFAYAVSHELRAPLRALQGFAQALLEDYAPQLDAHGQDYARRIARAAEHMDTLIQDLLAYSRLGRAALPLQAVPLAEVVAEAQRLLQAEIAERRAQVTVVPPLPVVYGHRTTLVHAVANLLSNAIKFVAPGVRPRVRLWAEVRQGRARLWVEDNGIGIAAEHHERIFRVFERLHGTEAYPGTGVGLALVRRGVERLGGRVGVESAPGQGSRFWIELPQATGTENARGGT